MLGYSYMVRSLTASDNSESIGEKEDEKSTKIILHTSDCWVVWGKVKRRTKKQIWRDKLARLGLTDFDRIATLGVGGFGR